MAKGREEGNGKDNNTNMTTFDQILFGRLK